MNTATTTPPAAIKPGGMDARRAEHQSQGQTARAGSAKGGQQIGPQVGVPPSLQQVPLNRLQVDPAYQRATDSYPSRRIIAGMVREWNWTLCQPLAVSRRADGSLFVLDGQHRLTGARERGDIPYLPCVIASNLDLAGEANAFVKINIARQKLGENDVFFGMLAAGDPLAVRVQQIMEETGWTLARHRKTNAFKPGELICAPMLVRKLKVDGEESVRFALSALRAAYPYKGVSVVASMLGGLFNVFDAMLGGDCGFTTQQLIAALAATPPAIWIARRDTVRGQQPNLTQQAALCLCMIKAARGDKIDAAPASAPTPSPMPSSAHPAIAARIATPPAPRPGATPLMPRPAPAAKSPFGAEGKGWCDQCQSLRSRQHAVACGDRFCSLREHA